MCASRCSACGHCSDDSAEGSCGAQCRGWLRRGEWPIMIAGLAAIAGAHRLEIHSPPTLRCPGPLPLG